MLCRAGVFTALAVVLSFSSASALSKQGAGIVYDAEYTKLQEQHGEVWAAEDAAIQERLDAMRAKFGKPPNIIHIMWDDHSLGEVGDPMLNKVYGYDTPHINQLASKAPALRGCTQSLPAHQRGRPSSQVAWQCAAECTRWASRPMASDCMRMRSP